MPLADGPLRPTPVPRGPMAAANARRQVAAVCRDWPSEYGHTAVLLTSELVTNALSHTTGEVGLWIGLDGHLLRVEVSDCSPSLPRPRFVSTGEGEGLGDRWGGRGLLLVAGLATAWGVRRHADGKTVWFELRPEL